MKEKYICSCHDREFSTSKQLYTHNWYFKNREKRLSYHNNYNNINKSKQKEWRKNNNEEQAKYHKYNSILNKKRINNNSKKWYGDNKEKHNKKVKEYQHTFKGKIVKKAADSNRRLILKNCSKLNKKVIEQIYEENLKQFGVLTCELCFKILFKKDISLDHSIPVCRIDEFCIDLNKMENLKIAHNRCNKTKNSKTLDEWFQLYPNFLKEKVKALKRWEEYEARLYCW